MQNRFYQDDGISEIRSHFKRGLKKILLWLATGGGKTHMFSYMMIEAKNNGKRSLMIVRGRKLVDQASKRLFHENVTHGVMMAGHWNRNAVAPIQIASIDTLMARGWRPKADLIVIDEAHMAVSKGYRDFLEDYPDAFIVAVTATPYSNRSLRHIADEIVHPITVQELIDEGFLVKARYFAPSNPDLNGVRTDSKTGDYVTKQLAEVMDVGSVMGDVISHWKRLAENRPTIVFAVSVDHSKHLASEFCNAGIPAEHFDADTPEVEREAIMARSKNGTTKIITNVGILTTGVDMPWIRCIDFVRPTKSYNLYIQMAGRGTRPMYEPGFDIDTKEGRAQAIQASCKRDFLIIDHAGNVNRHGFINAEPKPNLDGTFKDSGFGGRMRTCKQCFAVVEAFPCPGEVDVIMGPGEMELKICGWSPPERDNGPRSVLEVAGELKEIYQPTAIERFQCEQFCEEQLQKFIDEKKNPWGAYHVICRRFEKSLVDTLFFKICKKHKIDVWTKRKKVEDNDGFPFK